MNKTDTPYPQEQRPDPRFELAGSPLASVGIQARNFTAPIESASGIAPVFYSPDSLAADVEHLCDPDQVVTNARLLNVAVKYFFSYVHEGAHEEMVEYGEVAGLYEQFSRHQSMNEPSDDIEIMNRLRQWSPVLRVLADAPRAAHVMRAVIDRQDAPKWSGGPYIGVDVGAGTGIMLLALQIQARRNGFSDIQTLGYQNDQVSGERTHDLVHTLGAGSVMLADPNREGAYGLLRGKPISFIANEVLAGIQRSLTAENCFTRYRMLRRALEGNFTTAAFFPDGVIAHSTSMHSSVILARENGFQPPAAFLDDRFVPQGLIMEGRVMPMHKLGEDFFPYLK